MKMAQIPKTRRKIATWKTKTDGMTNAITTIVSNITSCEEREGSEPSTEEVTNQILGKISLASSRVIQKLHWEILSEYYRLCTDVMRDFMRTLSGGVFFPSGALVENMSPLALLSQELLSMTETMRRYLDILQTLHKICIGYNVEPDRIDMQGVWVDPAMTIEEMIDRIQNGINDGTSETTKSAND